MNEKAILDQMNIRFDKMEKMIGDLITIVGATNSRLVNLEKTVENVEQKVDSRLETIESRLENIEKEYSHRIRKLEVRVEKDNKRIDIIEDELQIM